MLLAISLSDLYTKPRPRNGKLSLAAFVLVSEVLRLSTAGILLHRAHGIPAHLHFTQPHAEDRRLVRQRHHSQPLSRPLGVVSKVLGSLAGIAYADLVSLFCTPHWCQPQLAAGMKIMAITLLGKTECLDYQ